MDFDNDFDTITPLATNNLTISSTTGLILPTGTTVQRPTGVTGLIRYNTTTPSFEGFTGSVWVNLSDSYQSKVSVSDTTPSFLSSKIVAGTNITIATNNSGANETLSITWPFTAGNGISFTSSQISLSAPVSIANGGTGQTTANAALNALLPTQTGNAGEYLTTDGTNASWAPISVSSAIAMTLATGAWISDGGGYYHQDVAHNLNTLNTIQEFYRADTSEMIRVNKVTIIDANTISVQTYGLPTFNITTVIQGGSVSTNISVQANGGSSSSASTLNFAGSGVTVSTVGGVSTINIPTPVSAILKSYTYYAFHLDSPNTSDWAINALAPATPDSVNSSLNVRQFSNTTEQGIGFSLNIPTGATEVTFRYRGRPLTAPVASATIQLRLYSRLIPSGSAIGTWSAGSLLTAVTVGTNVFFTQYTQTSTLASLSLTAGNMYQFELTRNTAVAGNLSLAWLLSELIIEFS